ncbi:MAG: thioredoxin-disulfide reductase [Rhodospirillales bacterium]|jgi:thioredoxin reductase (NADPH)|nr:thioredoxin-disulfide reductase [Rhodospirillaceae bacterium]MDP6427820.1 thioredoxin-disulfide reductase [Rhodospirillales bacterium]MDP6646298.1 thioredoxin-disulfide reductase [Rhodospirillales bacterium]MDP6842617.1 thioredoxin-disulfide reductase [Rhodospirillales bacterium]|tara:strand:+ start:175 stop:1146 length:972 start_codon:yes stop_codon:yes gene_type:complete
MAKHHSKVLILGSGAAGLTAAIYTARAGLEPTLIHGMQPGGQMTITTDVENYPGFAEVIQGPWLMEQMQAQAEKVGTKMISDLIVEADLGSRPIRLKGDQGDEYTADALIICTGAEAKWLGLESEQTYQGFGVSACATCDGFFYRGREVAVIGGGNTAVEEALYLTNHADKVTLVHRRDELRAEKMLQGRLLKHDKIEVMWDSVLDEVIGKDDGPMPEVTGIKVKNVKTGEVTEVPLSGVFIAIGHKPNTDLFVGQLEMDDEGYLITNPDSTGTKLPAVFAAGDVQDNKFRQAVTAAGTGCMAALEVEKYLAEQEAGDMEAAE